MDKIDKNRCIELLIEYFSTGNKETDAVAKRILQYADDYPEYWQPEVERIQSGVDWSGIRSVEADILTEALSACLKKEN